MNPPKAVAHVSKEIADAFGMWGLPNTIVEEQGRVWNQDGCGCNVEPGDDWNAPTFNYCQTHGAGKMATR